MREVKRPGIRGGRWYRTRSGRIRYGLQFAFAYRPGLDERRFAEESARLRGAPFRPWRAVIDTIDIGGRHWRLSPRPDDDGVQSEERVWAEAKRIDAELNGRRRGPVELPLYPHRRDMESDARLGRRHDVIVTGRVAITIRPNGRPYAVYRFRHDPECRVCARGRMVRAKASERAQSLLLSRPIHEAAQALGEAALERWPKRWDHAEAIRRQLTRPEYLSSSERHVIPYPDYLPPFPPSQSEQWPDDRSAEKALRQYEAVPEPHVLQELLSRLQFAARCVAQAQVQGEAIWSEFRKRSSDVMPDVEVVDRVFAEQIAPSIDPLMREAERVMQEYNEICRRHGLYKP